MNELKVTLHNINELIPDPDNARLHDRRNILAELMLELSAKTKDIVDLRVIRGGFCVMVAMGNFMRMVPGSIKNTPQESLEYCLDKWNNRSINNPFI